MRAATIVAFCFFATATAVNPLINVGDCTASRITKVESYFADEPLGEAGAVITFSNGLMIVGQHDDKEALLNRKGDNVTLCLEQVPKDCPPDDDRGRVYRVINKTADHTFSIMNGPHMCGGA